MDKVQLSIYLDEDQHDTVKKMAEKDKRSINMMINILIDEAIKERSKPKED